MADFYSSESTENVGNTTLERVRQVHALTLVVVVDGDVFDMTRVALVCDQVKRLMALDESLFRDQAHAGITDIACVVINKGHIDGPLDGFKIPVPLAAPKYAKDLLLDNKEESN